MVAIDARAPLYDGGICTRIDCVSLGVVVNREARRFYDEGEDFWPKRYAIWGRLVAQQPEQIAYSVIDSKVLGRFMPSVFPPIKADTIEQLANALELSPNTLRETVDTFNRAVVPGSFNHQVLDDCRTTGDLKPPKTHWAQKIDTPPFMGYALRPGIIDTEIHDSSGIKGRVKLMRDAIPMKREGTAEEVADAIMWIRMGLTSSQGQPSRISGCLSRTN